MRYSSSEPGQLYLIGVRAGVDELQLLLPPPGSAPAQVPTSGKLDLPVDALGPGMWKFAFVVARQPIDLATHGWVVDDTAWKRQFAGHLAIDKRGLLPWSIPKCAPVGANCESAYAAAAFELKIDAAAPHLEVAKQAPVQPTIAVRKAERATRSAPIDAERSSPKSVKATVNPECEKILLRMSLGEASQDLIDRMKTLKCG